MNLTKFLVLATLAILSALAIVLAKSDTDRASDKKGMKPEKLEEETETPVKDAGGATSEGTSSDFDIQQLMKLIEALKNQDFDEVDKAFKDSKIEGGPVKTEAIKEESDNKGGEESEEKFEL